MNVGRYSCLALDNINDRSRNRCLRIAAPSMDKNNAICPGSFYLFNSPQGSFLNALFIGIIKGGFGKTPRPFTPFLTRSTRYFLASLSTLREAFVSPYSRCPSDEKVCRSSLFVGGTSADHQISANSIESRRPVLCSFISFSKSTYSVRFYGNS